VPGSHSRAGWPTAVARGRARTKTETASRVCSPLRVSTKVILHEQCNLGGLDLPYSMQLLADEVVE
jgi:hypothetical protein